MPPWRIFPIKWLYGPRTATGKLTRPAGELLDLFRNRHARGNPNGDSLGADHYTQWSPLVALAERVVGEHRLEEPVRPVAGLAHHVAADVVGVDDHHAAQRVPRRRRQPGTQRFGELRGDLRRIRGRQLRRHVRRVRGVFGGAVDGAYGGTGDPVEPAALAQRLAHHAHRAGEQDPEQPDLLQRQLHGPGTAQPDAVRGADHVPGEGAGPPVRLDLPDEVRPALRDRDDLLGHHEIPAPAEDVPTRVGGRLRQAGHVPGDRLGQVVALGEQFSTDRIPRPLFPVDRDLQLLVLVGIERALFRGFHRRRLVLQHDPRPLFAQVQPPEPVGSAVVAVAGDELLEGLDLGVRVDPRPG